MNSTSQFTESNPPLDSRSSSGEVPLDGKPSPNAVDHLMTQAEVSDLIRKSKSQITRLVKKARFPAPLRVGRTPMWTKAQFHDWITSQVQQGGGA